METTIIDGLAQYGPLGLWTASLLFMNWQQRKDKLADEKAAKEAMAYHQEKIATALLNQTHMIQATMDKIEGGLAMVREKYAEERMFRMKNDK
jgi:hypothetical protein